MSTLKSSSIKEKIKRTLLFQIFFMMFFILSLLTTLCLYRENTALSEQVRKLNQMGRSDLQAIESMRKQIEFYESKYVIPWNSIAQSVGQVAGDIISDVPEKLYSAKQQASQYLSELNEKYKIQEKKQHIKEKSKEIWHILKARAKVEGVYIKQEAAKYINQNYKQEYQTLSKYVNDFYQKYELEAKKEKIAEQAGKGWNQLKDTASIAAQLLKQQSPETHQYLSKKYAEGAEAFLNFWNEL